MTRRRWVDARSTDVVTRVEAPDVEATLFAVGFGAVWMTDFQLGNLYRIEAELDG